MTQRPKRKKAFLGRSRGGIGVGGWIQWTAREGAPPSRWHGASGGPRTFCGARIPAGASLSINPSEMDGEPCEACLVALRGDARLRRFLPRPQDPVVADSAPHIGASTRPAVVERTSD